MTSRNDGDSLRLGAIGLGRAFSSMASSLKTHPCVRLVAAADVSADALRACTQDFAVTPFDNTDVLLRSRDIDAVYIATPHELHVSQVLTALEHGKHVIVEKPMALSLDDGRRMIETAERYGRYLIVGHSHGSDPPPLHAARLISSGAFGALRMVTALNYTDWIYRPRRPEELLPSSYGVALNQASHQIDIVRMLAGGMAVSVRAVCGRWDGERPTIGAYQAMIEFENGAVGSLIYNGYDHFDSDELNGWTDELGQPKIRDRHGSARRTLKLQRASDSEAEIKRSAGYGGAGARRATSSFGIDGQGHQQFGVIIASCERGDIRTSTTGVTIYDAEGRREIALHPGRGGGSRSGVFDQLYDAVIHGVTPVHSGRWGLANLEVCLAMVESSQTRRDVPLKYQLHPELGVAADLKPA